MILSDRIGLIWAIIVAAIIVALSSNASESGYPWFGAFLFVAGAPWLLLRALDFIVTGRVRGKAASEVWH